MSSPATSTPVGSRSPEQVAALRAPVALHTAENSARYMEDLLHAGEDILDVGCGGGSLTLDLAELVSPGHVVGVDIDGDLVTLARQAARAISDTGTRFLLADAEALPFADDSFDLVHAHQLLGHTREPVAALREMARVCRPGGHIATRVIDVGTLTWFPDLPALDEWRQMSLDVALSRGHEPRAARHLRQWANRAGLTDAYLTASVTEYADTDACHGWGRRRVTELDGIQGARALEMGYTEAHLTEMREAWGAWAADPDAVATLVHGELIARVG